jgi:hypothetical protein
MNSRCRPATERDQQFAKVEEIVLLLKSEELVFARAIVRQHIKDGTTVQPHPIDKQISPYSPNRYRMTIYLFLPVNKIFVGSTVRQASPAVWIAFKPLLICAT